MSVYIGEIKCSICNERFQNENERIYIPRFEANELHPLYEIGGMIVHQACLDKHPLKEQIKERIKEIENIQKRPVVDYITGREEELSIERLGHDDNLVNVFYITDDKNNPLYKYNGISLNKRNLFKWKEYNIFLDLLKQLDESEEWKGNAIKSLISHLTSAERAPYSQEFLDKMKERYGKDFGENYELILFIKIIGFLLKIHDKDFHKSR